MMSCAVAMTTTQGGAAIIVYELKQVVKTQSYEKERQRERSCIHTLVELVYGPTLLVASSHVGIVHVMTGLDVMPVI